MATDVKTVKRSMPVSEEGQTLSEVITVIDGLWVVKIAKGWLALTRDEVQASLQRGERLRRRLQFRACHPKEDA